MSYFRVNFLTYIKILFFVLVFAFPRILQTEKVIIMLPIILSGFLLKKFQSFNSKNLIFYLLIIAISLVVGLFKNNDTTEILNGLRIYLFFPILIFLLLITILNEELEFVLKKAIYLSIIIISLFAFSSLLNGIGLFPINLNSLFYSDEKDIGIHEGYFHVINSSLSTLIFLIPFYYSNLKDRISIKNPEMYVLFFALIICVISSRRILLLPFIFVYLLNIKRLKYISVLLVIFLIFMIYEGFISQVFVDTFFDRLSDAVNERGDSEVRDIQKNMFLKYIEEEPYIGYGLGGYMPDYLRNEEFKSAYEASFYYLFFVLGIPIALGFAYFYYQLFKDTYLNSAIFTDFYRKGLVWGALCLLLASYTNPYWMSSFDFIVPFTLLLRSAKKNI